MCFNLALSEPAMLSQPDKQFYEWLLNQEKGHLEQEFIPRDRAEQAIQNWFNTA